MFAGYSGLEMGVGQVFDAKPVWFAEIDQAPARILQHHYPRVQQIKALGNGMVPQCAAAVRGMMGGDLT